MCENENLLYKQFLDLTHTFVGLSGRRSSSNENLDPELFLTLFNCVSLFMLLRSPN